MRTKIPKKLLTAALLGAFIITPTAAQERSWFDRLDANDDGRITWNEYRRGMHSLDSRRGDRGGRFGRQGRTDQTGRFERESRTDQTGRFERRDDRDHSERERDERGRHGSRDRYDRRDRELRRPRSEYTEYLRAEFRWLDRNDDGVISRREAGSNAPRQFQRGRWN